MQKKRLAVLIGHGSRLPAILKFCQKNTDKIELAVVVSYKKETPMIPWMNEKGIPGRYHHWFTYKQQGKTRDQFNADLAALLKEYNTDMVLGVGWDIIWTPIFLRAFPDRVFNAHPFPLPDEAVETMLYEGKIIPVLRGMNALERAWDLKLPITGACVHIARETIDVGPVIARDILSIKTGESLDSLKKRHLVCENRLLTKALGLIAQEKIRVINGHAEIDEDNQIITDLLPKKTILVIGGGGREHALVWKLSQSRRIEKIYCAPGNAGTALLGENIPISSTAIDQLLAFVKSHTVDLTLVGPEAPLALGIVDLFIKNAQPIFGPSKAAARLETSKTWAIEFMKRHNIRHPQSEIFTDVKAATDYVHKIKGPCVVKADGLALGKGVFVCDDENEAKEAIKRIMIDKEFGEAGNKIVIQERLNGQEVSVMAFCDGKVAIPIVPAQDHKRIFDNDRGPNTGGIGAYAPAPLVTPRLGQKIHRILTLTIEAMKEEGLLYKGILYGGFMIVDNQPYVLEYNCRFGDPETQVQLPLLKSDLVTIINDCIDEGLSRDDIEFYDQHCACVILTSPGYPGKYKKGLPITGLEMVTKQNSVRLFHSGTSQTNGIVKTDGGRVLGISAVGNTLNEAVEKAYAVIKQAIYFEGMHYRKDIGAKALK